MDRDKIRDLLEKVRSGGTDVEEAMLAGHRAADGVMIYRHQDPKQNTEKFQIVRRLFHSWAEEH